jgi:hypothetical protein
MSIAVSEYRSSGASSPSGEMPSGAGSRSSSSSLAMSTAIDGTAALESPTTNVTRSPVRRVTFEQNRSTIGATSPE